VVRTCFGQQCFGPTTWRSRSPTPHDDATERGHMVRPCRQHSALSVEPDRPTYGTDRRARRSNRPRDNGPPYAPNTGSPGDTPMGIVSIVSTLLRSRAVPLGCPAHPSSGGAVPCAVVHTLWTVLWTRSCFAVEADAESCRRLALHPVQWRPCGNHPSRVRRSEGTEPEVRVDAACG
jgi:hypothetical protein